MGLQQGSLTFSALAELDAMGLAQQGLDVLATPQAVALRSAALHWVRAPSDSTRS